MKIHTGGFFGIPGDDYDYKLGIDYELSCDPACWSYSEILGILKEKGYPEVLLMYYKADEIVKELKNDEGAMEMVIESGVDGKWFTFYWFLVVGFHLQHVRHFQGIAKRICTYAKGLRTDTWELVRSYGVAANCVTMVLPLLNNTSCRHPSPCINDLTLSSTISP
ncbi:hypothetical protein MtrunA17_Chr3g0092311 [Medicago truncatula]|uniref:PB1-like domain-containing protein n=1 Tax=Medicago truncatula TaxID=3880 RepID=A0A396ILQ6_MEDTR|nr:hypothetical protein MtrunA17_Chr3g0092311 [Medicago truncatula]